MVGGDDHPALEAGVLAAGAGVAEVDEEERGEEDPREDVERPVDAVLAGVRVVFGQTLGGHAERYTGEAGLVTRTGGARAARRGPRAREARERGPAPERASIASIASSSSVRSAPRAPGRADRPPRRQEAGFEPVEIGSDRGANGLEGVGSLAGEEGGGAGQDRRVGLRVRGAADADQGLADHVVEAELGGVDRVAAEQRAERQVRALAGGGVLVERGGDQLGAAQRRHHRDRVGERRVERVGAVGEGVHRAGPQLRLGLARHRLGVGDHQARPDHRPRTRSSAPAGRRWIAVISAPDIVVGIAATVAPLTEASALATSITLPPPRATSAVAVGSSASRLRRPSTALRRPRRGREPAPAGPRARSAPRPPARPPGQRPRRAQQREGDEVAALDQLRRPLQPVGAEDDGSAGVLPDEVAAHYSGSERGFLTGLRFGSTSARRCSKSGGSESFSPRCSSGSSTVKPGPIVAISKRTPLGSRK